MKKLSFSSLFDTEAKKMKELNKKIEKIKKESERERQQINESLITFQKRWDHFKNLQNFCKRELVELQKNNEDDKAILKAKELIRIEKRIHICIKSIDDLSNIKDKIDNGVLHSEIYLNLSRSDKVLSLQNSLVDAEKLETVLASIDCEIHKIDETSAALENGVSSTISDDEADRFLMELLRSELGSEENGSSFATGMIDSQDMKGSFSKTSSSSAKDLTPPKPNPPATDKPSLTPKTSSLSPTMTPATIPPLSPMLAPSRTVQKPASNSSFNSASSIAESLPNLPKKLVIPPRPATSKQSPSLINKKDSGDNERKKSLVKVSESLHDANDDADFAM